MLYYQLNAAEVEVARDEAAAAADRLRMRSRRRAKSAKPWMACNGSSRNGRPSWLMSAPRQRACASGSRKVMTSLARRTRRWRTRAAIFNRNWRTCVDRRNRPNTGSISPKSARWSRSTESGPRRSVCRRICKRRAQWREKQLRITKLGCAMYTTSLPAAGRRWPLRLGKRNGRRSRSSSGMRPSPFRQRRLPPCAQSSRQ
jgi:hypothetical protein